MLVVSQNVMGAQDPTNLFQLHESFIRPYGTNRQINQKKKRCNIFVIACLKLIIEKKNFF